MGAFTHYEYSIEFASLWDNYNIKEADVKQLRKVNNVIHELGHAFNVRLGRIPENSVHAYSIRIGGELWQLDQKDSKEEGQGFYFGDILKYGTMTWIQSIQTSPSEVFADMFIGWVYNKWEDSPQGEARKKFMNEYMRSWIRKAINQ